VIRWALVLAQELLRQGADQSLPLERRRFVYMPFMHSESLAIHEVAVQPFSVQGLEDNLSSKHQHREIIERLAVYPHRNAVLGRALESAELDFLKQPWLKFLTTAEYQPLAGPPVIRPWPRPQRP